jgi:hypothetical protein
MAGFLDRSSRIVDMVLTHEGQRALAEGRLNFTYWSAFDDGIHYDPWVADSGSLLEAEVTSSKYRQMEDTPILEALPGLARVPDDRDLTYSKWPLFTAPQGSGQVPRMIELAALGQTSGSYAVELKQRRVFFRRDGFDRLLSPSDVAAAVDLGFERVEPSATSLEYKYVPGSYPPEHPLQGVRIRVYKSGSDGLAAVDPRPDLRNRVALGAALVFDPRTR